MENSPPGIQAMPSGAGPGGRAGLGLVGRKPAAAAGEESALGFGRVAMKKSAAAMAAITSPKPTVAERRARFGLLSSDFMLP